MRKGHPFESYLEDKEKMSRLMDDFGVRERKCILRIANRLYDGQLAYGELSPGKKDWKKEAKEEAFDMAVYLSALLEDDNENA